MDFKKALTTYFGLRGKDAIKYALICRYYNRVSDRLKAEKKELEAKAELGVQELLTTELSKKNTLLDRIKSEDNKAWAYYQPIRILYEK
jgi:hypothetical protein